jgi:hypothetical protein
LKEKYKGERILKNKSNPLDFIGIKEKLEKKKKYWGTNFSTIEFEGGITKMGSLYYKLHINLQGSLSAQEAN